MCEGVIRNSYNDSFPISRQKSKWSLEWMIRKISKKKGR